MKRLTVVSCLLMVGLVSVALADRPIVPRKGRATGPQGMFQDENIGRMIDMATKQVITRYNLRSDQASAAKEMLKSGALAFVNKHRDEVTTLLPQLYQMQSMTRPGQKVTPEELKAIAQKVAPVYKEAMEFMRTESSKFHELLDDDQKALHQEDLGKFFKNVQDTQEKLNRWKEGKYKEGETLRPLRVQPGKPGIPGGKPGTPGQVRRPTPMPEPEPDVTSPTSLSYWEMYVKKFVEAFGLNNDQKTMAESVLNEKKVEAKAYREDHSREFQEVKKHIDRAVRLGTTQPDKDLKPWQAKLTKLEQPLLDMFNDLAEQLMAIPTEEQKAAAQAILSGDQPKAEAKDVKAEKK